MAYAFGDQCAQPARVVAVQNDIFDLSEPDTFFIHHWANALHIITKPITIEDQVEGFAPCVLDTDLAEVERHLRNQPYLRDARVTEQSDEEGDYVLVETWDNWSLLPTINFGRSGGESKFSVGLKDSNFLGYGVRTQLRYKSDYQRTGYELKFDAPLFLGKNANLLLVAADNDDGSQTTVAVRKPFVSLHNIWAGQAYFDDRLLSETIRQGGQDVNRFQQDSQDTSLWYGWSKGRIGDSSWRWLAGIHGERYEFSKFTSEVQPQDRTLIAPWFGFASVTDGFRKLKDIYLINQTEDVNFGREYGLRLGHDISQHSQSGQGPVWWAYYRQAFGLAEDMMLVTRWDFEGNRRSDGSYRALGSVFNEWFYRFNPKLASYIRLDATVSQNQYLDQPVTLGGDNGVRGYPLQFQHGQHAVSGSLELRYYPNINLFKLFEFGGVAFVDAGKTDGESAYADNNQELLRSVGVGLRAFSSFASNSNVVHVDFSRPLSNDPRVNGWEWRVEVKQHF
ncbi:hypothetical protein [Paraferrimonas sedimenticola]|uniref:hypothetical protein n=1 Tax=Paraferrimonas sedimenticola TaxID=375674 RepID=UPI000BA9130A|nr:hypothetical protein [Paraferrimonas sedimenticola]